MIDLDAPEEYKTKDKDFRYFQKECAYYQKELGLLSWRIFYDHIIESTKNNLAWTNAEETGMNATIVLNVDWKTLKPTEEDLSKTAFHEMCELLMWKLDEMARVGCSGNKCNAERHAVISTLENTLFPVLYKKRIKGKKK